METTTKPPDQAPVIDPARIAIATERARSEQDLLRGILAGAGGAIAGAAAWALITVFIHVQIGWMAIGVGVLVGWAVRTVGRGMDRSFAFAGALLALFGCLLGNLLAGCAMVARSQHVGFFTILSQLDPGMAAEIMTVTFSPMDLLFYAIAIQQGYKLSMKKLTPDELLQSS